MHTVGPVLLDSFVNNTNVTAIVWAGLPGQESGNSITDVLYGKVPPGGKSPFTWAARARTTAPTSCTRPTPRCRRPTLRRASSSTTGPLTGAARNPCMSFGHGLTYSTFEYSDLFIGKPNASAYTPASGMTSAAPSLSNASANLGDYLFPGDINGTRVPLYVYPYLNSTDAAAASSDPHYGKNKTAYIPEGAAGRLAAAGARGRAAATVGTRACTTRCTMCRPRCATRATSGAREVAQLYVTLPGAGVAEAGATRLFAPVDRAQPDGHLLRCPHAARHLALGHCQAGLGRRRRRQDGVGSAARRGSCR